MLFHTYIQTLVLYLLSLQGPTEQLVSPEPEFYITKRDPDEDEFLVLACDGVWDVMSNEDICQVRIV